MIKKRKKTLFRNIFRIFTMFLIVSMVSVFIALYKIDLESLRSDLVSALRDQTGLVVEIDGQMSWHFSLRPRVVVENVRVANSDWAQNKDFIKIKKVFVTLNLFSLFRDRPAIESMRLENPTVYLEINSDGIYSVTPEINTDHTQAADHSKPIYPFSLGMASLEIVAPRLYLITPTDSSEFAPDNLKIDYRKIKGNLEYNGYMSKQKRVYPFVISFSKFDEARKVYPVKAAFAYGGEALVANIALEGTSRIPIDFILTGKLKDLQSLLYDFGMDIPNVSTISVNIAGGFDHGKMNIRKSSISSRGGDMNISGSVNWKGTKPFYKLNIESDELVLADIFPDLYGGIRKKWVRPRRDLNVFKDTPLYIKEIMSYQDIEINADVKSLVVYRNLDVNNIKFFGKIEDSYVDVNATAEIGGGTVSAALKGAEVDGNLFARGAGRGENVSVGEIMREIYIDNFVSGLPANFEFYLEGQGDNLSSFMSSITGPLRIKSAGSGYAHSSLIGYMYGQDFLTSLRHGVEDLLSKDKKNSDRMKISCAAMNIKLRNGRIETERGIAAETAAINIRATGFVDLGQEDLRASLVSTPVRGIKLSISKNVINSIEFSGNLAEPDIKINGGAVAAKAISATSIGLLLAPFTGGIGILAGAGVGFLAGDLLESWLADDNPCNTALNYGAPAQKDDPLWLNQPIEELVGRIINISDPSP